MAEFKISLQKTLDHEGEYVNDPDDSGKETYRGISRANHGNWKGWSVIDQYKSNPIFLSTWQKLLIWKNKLNFSISMNFGYL